jgi:hypothetical protein
MTPLETLKAARQLISDPAKWTQGDFARDADGNEVNPNNDLATCYCSFGAIQFVNKESTWITASRHLDGLCLSKFGISLDVFNDTHTHVEVLALFDAAIAELEGVAT